MNRRKRSKSEVVNVEKRSCEGYTCEKLKRSKKEVAEATHVKKLERSKTEAAKATYVKR